MFPLPTPFACQPSQFARGVDDIRVIIAIYFSVFSVHQRSICNGIPTCAQLGVVESYPDTLDLNSIPEVFLQGGILKRRSDAQARVAERIELHIAGRQTAAGSMV
jgi:hypothetical protein